MTASELLTLCASVRQTGYRVEVTLNSWITMRDYLMNKGYGLELSNRYLNRYFYCDD